MRVLIQYQIDRKITIKMEGLNPMHLACMNGKYDVVTEFAKLNQKWVDATDDDKWTPLHFACDNCHKEVLQKLLKCMAKMCATKEDGKYPIHVAVMNQFTEGVEILLKARQVCANCKDKKKRTPLHYVGEYCKDAAKADEIMTLLLERYYNSKFL